MNGAKWVNGSDVEKSWDEFKSVVMETAEGVCGRKKSRMKSKIVEHGGRNCSQKNEDCI